HGRDGRHRATARPCRSTGTELSPLVLVRALGRRTYGCAEGPGVKEVTVKLAQVQSVALTGVHGAMITVEAHLAAGLPGTTVIGMGDAAVVQARDRVKAAVQSSGRTWPDTRITLALSPAGLPKRGAGYDLPLAVAVLA